MGENQAARPRATPPQKRWKVERPGIGPDGKRTIVTTRHDTLEEAVADARRRN